MSKMNAIYVYLLNWAIFPMTKVIASIFFILLFLDPKNAFGYANFIGHGYTSCITCHYNPFGNGPINDYGRGVSATAVSSRGFYSDSKPEDLISQESGFMFSEPVSKHFRPFASYRGLLLLRNFREETETTDYIHMQADLNMVAKFGENDKFISSFSFGYAPVPRALEGTPAGDKIKTYRSREHYIGYRPTSQWGIYAGLMDKPFGVRVVEHTAYSRTTPQLTMDDQSHGVIIHYNTPKLEGGVDVFVGNLTQDASLRMKGASGTFEYTVMEKTRWGASLLSQSNTLLSLMAASTHLRAGFDNGSSIILEIGRVTKKPKLVTGDQQAEYYINFQNHLQAIRGLYVLNSIEYYTNEATKGSRVRFGPSLQYFPMSKIELRVDLNNTRSFSNDASVKDRWDLMGQVHLWM
jgi:hypothetical protein